MDHALYRTFLNNSHFSHCIFQCSFEKLQLHRQSLFDRSSHRKKLKKINLSQIFIFKVGALNVAAFISFTIRMIADTENNMNALQRIQAYLKDNPQEKEWKNK